MAVRGHNRLTEAEQIRVRRVRRLAVLLDSQFRVPSTKIRFGLDSLFGLIPGVGDTITAVFAGYIIVEAFGLGVPRNIIVKMVGNIVLDWVIGSIPIIGDLFDIGFKANIRNIRLIEKELGLETGDT